MIEASQLVVGIDVSVCSCFELREWFSSCEVPDRGRDAALYVQSFRVFGVFRGSKGMKVPSRESPAHVGGICVNLCKSVDQTLFSLFAPVRSFVVVLAKGGAISRRLLLRSVNLLPAD